MDLEIEVAKFLEGCLMPVPDGKGVPIGLEGIEHLASKGLWKDALDMCVAWTINTSNYKDSNNIQESSDPESWLKVKQWQIVALSQMQMKEEFKEQINNLGDLDRERYTFQHFPQIYPGKQGTMVPFFLRFIRVRLLAGELSDNVTFIYKLKAAIREHWNFTTWDGKVLTQTLAINSPAVAQFWVIALECELANCALRREDHHLALNILEETMEKWQKDFEDDKIPDPNVVALPTPPFSLCGMLSHMMKVLLKIGNVEKAKAVNESARARFQQNVFCQAQLLLNDGLIYFAESEYAKAADSFKEAIRMNRQSKSGSLKSF